jgi:hypothetical protein
MRELGVEDEERDASEVVAVQMGEKDRANLCRIDPEPLHGDERGCPAVQQEGSRSGPHQGAGLEPAAAPESIARSEELHRHIVHPSSLRISETGGEDESRERLTSAPGATDSLRPVSLSRSLITPPWVKTRWSPSPRPLRNS